MTSGKEMDSLGEVNVPAAIAEWPNDIHVDGPF
jgi:hypothetical protein